MDLSRRLRSTALIVLLYTVLVPLSSARFHGIRHKRQNGARMYLPESFIIPGDEGDPEDWSEWSSPSECSRSCGGGVSYQTRECLRIESNGVAVCSGGNRKYFSCNTQDCPEEEPDFRSQQCSRFDNVPFDGVYYNWVPYTNAPNPCELNCMPVGERFYFHQKAKVIDGTRCNDKDLDVCVDGVCQPVGCDMMLGSDAKEDKCRKCGGDGSTCKTISDTLTTNNLAAGYNDILLIPSGATNIRIQETAPSNNYLACRNLSSHYYLNGNWRIDFPRPMFYAGSWWNYQRKPTGFAAPDYLTCSGPITESIYIVMLVQDRNVSINYEYSIPTSVIQNTPDVYSWTHMEFGPCSASCGGGTQTRTVTCNNRLSLGEVDPSLCDAKAKPAETQECGQEPCAPSWIEGEWGKCSKGCGEDGFQNRTITCERISPNGEQTVEEDAVCLQLVGNKPATTMECNRDVENCPKYHLGPWKPCDKLCGEGNQVRKVTCYIEENGRKKILPESECVEEKPETEKSCMLTPCEGVDWIISQWSGCDACGQNAETRTAICGSKSGKVYSEEFCGPEVPLLSRPCKSPKCPTQWFSSEWSKCSAACGKGVQSRVVLCGIFNGQSITTASNEEECDASSKPESEQECEGEEKECPGEWFTGPWGVCSETCGGGERVREVLCLANGTKSSNCDQSKLEFASEKCNTHACSDDEVIPVDPAAKSFESEDDDEDECDEDTSEFDVEFVTDKMSEDLKISEGISLDEETTTSSSLITDELMLSDAPSSDETEFDESSTDISLSTIEGSGESTDSTDITSLGVSEGSGDDTDATTISSDSTAGSSIDSVTIKSTASTEAVSSSSTEFSTGLTEESDATISSTVEGDASTKSADVSETSEESSHTTSKDSTTEALSITETSEKSSDTTNGDSTTESISTDESSESTDKSTDITRVSDSTIGLSVTDVTESTLMSSGSTEISSESTSSDGSLTTDDSTSENTKSTDLLTTDASSSSESSTDDLTLETADSTLASSESTVSSSAGASITTEADTSQSTDTSVSTESDTTESTDASSTDNTSSTESDTTASTETSSTDTPLSTESVITELTSDITSSTSSDSSSDLTTDGTSSTESSTSSSRETSEDSSILTSSSGTTQVSDETTPSSTASNNLSTESSYGSTLSSTSIDTDSTDKTTESPKTDTTDVSDSADATTISSSIESDSTEQETTSTSGSTVTTDISETTASSSASSTEAITTDIASSKSTSVTDATTLTTSSADLSEQTTDLSESTTDLSKLTTYSTTGASDSLTESSKSTTDSSESTTELLESSSISSHLTTDLSDSTTDSSDLMTDSSDLTTDSSDLTTDSSELTTDSSDLTTDSSDLTTVSSEITESSTMGLTTVSSSSSDLSLSTDKTTVDFWSSTNTDETEETSEKSTPNTLQSVITKETKPRKCKAKKTKKDCNKKQFGCCPDKVTAAKGPFDEGCPVVKTCAETEFGCCLDGVSPAQDKQLKGCPSSQCAETLFGCCPDKFTPAEGEDNEGCPEPTTLPPTSTTEEITDISTETTDSTTVESVESVEPEDTSTETTTEQEEFVKSCSFAEFGCCPDGETEAKGENFMGCDSVGDSKDCSKSIHGCCHDGRTFATGPEGQGCASCTKEPFGCCQDNQTPAHGPLGEGCCLNSAFGCCPDNINFAYGPNFEGCDCTHTPYGCCPDKKQAARGYNNEGCSCETLKFGCCPDKITPAAGPKFEGCACHTMQYGCCPDGATFAQGPHHYGCHCSQSKFKCCQDEKTSAKGPNYEGCTCLESKFGCCPDGVTSAQGEKFEGCENVKEPLQKACGLPKETGNCSSFAIKFFFDTAYGACARFWYGGCGGNDNKFETEAQCKATCQEFNGKEACLLPKSSGPCTGYNKKWYFNSDRNRCEEFNYGGCYGTSNRFDSIEECQALCAVSESIPPCEQPVDEGPCEGNFERWFYDNETDVCQPFRYGGCKGNKNNYPTEHSCNYNCRQPGVHKDYCSLPKQTGDCSEQHARWHYSESDKKCMPFYYTGCGGNKNSFRTLESCEDHCPKEVAKDVCEIPAEVGECQNYTSMWYYDTKDERCRQFYYGGCGGNGNKFQTEAECLQRCEHKPEETPVPEPERQTPEQSVPPASSQSTGDICAEQPDVGSCRNFTIEWYFDADKSRCQRFYYGGCEGNENRFSTEEECAQRCQTPKTPVAPPTASQEANICESPSDHGPCQENIIRWFFNAKEDQCQRFYYGGCDGNENRFETEQECSQRCSEPKLDIDTRFAEPNEVETPPDNKEAPSDEEICLLTPVLGDCNDNVTRWFYKSAEGLCDEFMYSGCGGNGNNFDSEDACQNSCYHVQTTCTLPPVPGRCDDNSTRWYFDERAGSCYEFEFSGCRGNRNNFVTEAECMDFCAAQPNQPDKSSEPVAPVYSLCDLPVEVGECENNTLAWFYDTETMSCTAFTYTGCGGNGNRFESKEQCDRQCGEFKGIDVCNEPVQTGPCKQWQALYYFNKASRSCEPFTYGGCDGTGNRFVLRSECESLCIVGQEPQTTTNKDICKIPVNSGRCEGQSIHERRWYYDDERGTCISFIYAGCSGNQNNFRSYESCINFCTNPEESNERTNEVIPDRCESYESECQQLRCQYGVQRTTVEDSCTRCSCKNPCEQHSCPEGQQCAVDVTSDTSRQFEPVCRSVNKPGECPLLTSSSTNCARECYTDADCRGDNKCCADGCGFVCVRPTVPTQATIRPTTPLPAVIYPGEVQVSLEPKKPQELDVQTSAGGIAVLRCFATGIPAPNVTWSRHNVVIDTNQGRYVLTSSGDLTIVQVRQTDTGSYVCVADNGLGAPVQREIKLQVTEPQNTPAYIFGNKNVTQIVTLNSPALVRCPAGGHPAPQVSWWRNKTRLGLIGQRYEMTRDYALMFHAIQLSDLGHYTCQAYNHRRRPVSMKITLKAVGPARAVNRNDVPFLQYVIDPATAPITPRPVYPYRPTRPYAPPPPPVVVRQPQLVSARAVLVRDPRNTYSLSSTVLLACEVQGYPAPNVTWTKDGVPLSAGERIQITADPHRLVINDVTADDTGLYGCTARNSFSYNTSEEKVAIESVIPVHPDCVDNRHFANCYLIVKGNYCTHQYYAKFCCRSCTLAGQLSGAHPNAV